MAAIVTSAEIAQPPDDVFRYVTDPSRLAELESVISGPSTPGVGFEPTTLRLTAECSAIELPRTVSYIVLPRIVGRSGEIEHSRLDHRVAVGAQ